VEGHTSPYAAITAITFLALGWYQIILLNERGTMAHACKQLV